VDGKKFSSKGGSAGISAEPPLRSGPRAEEDEKSERRGAGGIRKRYTPKQKHRKSRELIFVDGKKIGQRRVRP